MAAIASLGQRLMQQHLIQCCMHFNLFTYPKVVKEKEGKNIVHESKIF